MNPILSSLMMIISRSLSHKAIKNSFTIFQGKEHVYSFEEKGRDLDIQDSTAVIHLIPGITGRLETKLSA